MLRQEWHSLFKNKILLIVTVAVIAIPTIYTTLFLGSMWDPYGNLDKLPVAVINHDVPVTYADQKLDIGGTRMVHTIWLLPYRKSFQLMPHR